MILTQRLPGNSSLVRQRVSAALVLSSVFGHEWPGVFYHED